MAVSDTNNRADVKNDERYLGFDVFFLTPLCENLTHLKVAVDIILYVVEYEEVALQNYASGTSTTIGFFAFLLAFSFCFIFCANEEQ